MDDIQRAIDEFSKRWCVPFSATYSTTEQKKRKFNSELKALLEQVAKEQMEIALFRYSLLSARNHDALLKSLENTSLVTKNLTFEE